jgi:tRNA 5-methylaminomethyl-2-thiouridine biosynthesis bifunctional protein
MGGNCMLTLIFDDVNAVMPGLDEKVDCWFLDGFKPKKNPEMWTETVFENMARMSNGGAFATFTAAGFVRRGCGGRVRCQAVKGYGTKWHMLTGCKAMKVAIIGAGLAGTAAAWALRQAGAEPVIYEAGPEIAPGASGNPVGLYNPRLSAERSFYSDAFPLALKAFEQLRDTDWNECGALHLITDEKRQKKFTDAVKSWGWPRGEMRIVNKAEASEIAGVGVHYDALYLARSGTISPKKLCGLMPRRFR